jgi:hypothetical protein
MARENVMSTPIFDQLLREMAQRAEQHVSESPVPEPLVPQEAEQRPATSRRRHRAD